MAQYTVKDAITIRDDIIRTKRNGLIRSGVTNPNLGPGTDDFNGATALGNELAVIGSNNIIRCDGMMPDTATGDDIERIGNVWEKEKQPAAGSVGDVLISCSQASPVVTGAQLTDSGGLRFEVVTGNDFTDQERITIRAIDVGAATNHAEGDILQWKNAPPFASDKVVVASGGLENGIDAEDDEALRARLYDVLRVPAESGNPEEIIEDAEDSTPSVQKAYCYPAVQGPSTADVAVTAAPTLTSKSRVLNSLLVDNKVKPYVVGRHPTNVHFTITTVVDVPCDVSVGLGVPEAPTANPPGPGGGWTNGSPWPAPDGVSTFKCTVTGVTSTTVFTVDAVGTPIADVTRIMWISPYDWEVRTALVTAVSGTTGAWVITIDQPFTGLTTGCFICPEVQNAETYRDLLLARFALMGPGEKSSNVSALIRGFRHPPPALNWPYTLGAHLLGTITKELEVSTADFLYRTDGTTTINGPGSVVTPQVNAAYAAPNQFIPRHIGFYRMP